MNEKPTHGAGGIVKALKKYRAVYVPYSIPNLVKESIRRRSFNRTFDASPHASVLHALRRDGAVNLGQLFSSEQCAQWATHLKKLIDSHPEHLKTYDDQTDRRFYGVNEITSAFDDFVTHQQIGDIRDTYLGPLKSGFLLGAHIHSGPNNTGSGGGWHRDSLVHAQIKAIVYLTETTADNGPFQYIRGSHRNYATLWAAGKLDQSYRQDRYDTADYISVFDEDPNLLEFAGPAGTVILTDTSGIHRGKPLVEGERCALTHYLFHAHHTKPEYAKFPRPSRLPEYAQNKGRGFENPLNPIEK